MRIELTRDVTRAECPWLEADLPRGTVLRYFDGCTYGCISNRGIPASQDGNYPFFEIPDNAWREMKPAGDPQPPQWRMTGGSVTRSKTRNTT